MVGVARERVDPLAARMAERRRGASLALGALGDPALARDHLQRDVQAVALVAREPDVAHPTRTERPKRPVASEDQVMRERRGHVGFYFAPRRSPFSAEDR